MALTVTSNTTPVLAMDATTEAGGTWTKIGGIGGNPAVDSDIFADTASINGKLSATRGGYFIISTTSRDIGSTSTRSGMVAFWAQVQGVLTDTVDTGGITIRMGTATNVYHEWQVATKTGVNNTQAYPGGFQRFVIDVSTSPNTTSGTVDMGAVTFWAIQFDISNTISGNIKNVWMDRLDILTEAQITAGTSACTVTGTVATAGSLFSEIADDLTADGNAVQAFARKVGGVIGLNQPMQIGTTSGTNTFTSKSENCVWQAQKVSDGFFYLRFTGGTGADTFTFGTKSGADASAVGIAPTLITSAGPRWYLTASGTNIETFQMYGSNFSKMTNCFFGTASTALGTTGTNYEAISTTLRDLSGELTLNIGADTREENANRVLTSTNARGSINLIDATAIDVTDWQIVNATGFENSGTAGTRTVTGQSFINAAANKPYVSILDNASAIWNLNNPNNGSGARPTIGATKAELNFDGTASTNGTVNENYIVTWTTQTPAGGALNNVRVKIVESDDGAGNPALVNEGTSSSGSASSTYLRAKYVPNGAGAITATTHVPAAFKSYLYGYLPFFSSATINQPVSVTATHVDDPYDVETAAQAITDGEVTNAISIIEAGTYENSLIKFTGGSGGTLSDNQTIAGAAASGSLVGKIIEGDDSAGTILIDGRNVSNYTNGETINNGAGWTATYTASSEQRFHWIIDAGLGNNRSAQNVYDYIMAKLDLATAATSPPIDKLIIAGRAEFGTPFQGVSTGPNKFKTVSNTALTRGWAIANLNNLGSITQFTDNADAAFTPAATVSLTVTIKNQTGDNQAGVEVAIFQSDTARTVVLASTSTDDSGEVTTVVASGLGGIIIRARQSTDIATFLTTESTSNGIQAASDLVHFSSNHNFQDGDAVVYSKNGGSVTTNLTDGTTYYLNSTLNGGDVDSVTVHATAAAAVAGTGIIDLASGGADTHQFDPVRFVAGSATGTVGTTDFATTITLITDNIATG